MKSSIFRFIRKKCSVWLLLCASLGFVSVGGYAASPELQGYVLQVQMTPAICAIDNSRQKQRKCLEGYALTISGLLPESTKPECSTRSSASLTPLQAKVVARVMPDESARVQLWRSVGGCTQMNASQYFRTMINFADRLKIPAELTGSENRQVQQTALRAQFLRLNPGMTQNSIRFSCQNLKSAPVLTEVQVCYKVNGQYRQCSTHVVSSCPANFSIQGSY